MGKFKINDRHIAFCNAVASGMERYKAYQEFMSPGKKAAKQTAAANASNLLKRPEIKEIIDRARAAHEAAITGQVARQVAEEFSTTLLTIDEMDNWHSAVIQGKILVEEVVPVWTVNETLNGEGKVIKRQRVQNFVKVSRPANIKEKQFSVQELYKRFGSYAPSRFLGAFGKVSDEGEIENVERMLVLSTGEKIPLPI